MLEIDPPCTDTGVPHSEIEAALGRTYGFGGWPFDNEAEFKHELFHQLAQIRLKGVSLSEAACDVPTCRLHAEGKVENGNPRKADLLICDPARLQTFNYAVDALLELKQSLTPKALAAELDKISTYRKPHKARYLVSQQPLRFPVEQYLAEHRDIRVLDPLRVESRPIADFSSDAAGDLNSALSVVRSTLDEVLLLYGNGRAQYHSFFWCNYEHETWRRHSFPCEGDFVAQLYHRLRLRLPSTIEIRSEVHPPGQPTRVDLVLRNLSNSWCIPIDVKMNWDQFKPKFRNGNLLKSEAETIMQRLAAIAAQYDQAHPMVVVIQGEWQLPRDIRSSALPILRACLYPLELVMFNEIKGCVTRTNCGPH